MVVIITVSAGELFDRLGIVQLKRKYITDPDKLRNLDNEFAGLVAPVHSVYGLARTKGGPDAESRLMTLSFDLSKVNALIWDVEEKIRDHERRGDFGPEFVELARSVYKHNDERARIKRLINVACGSYIVEEKSY